MALIHQVFDPLKAFLSFLLACLGVSAATPSFGSFNTNQFTTNNLFISIKDGAVLTNLNVVTDLFINSTNVSNLFAPSSVTNDLVRFFNTNQFTTNVSGLIDRRSIFASTWIDAYPIIYTNLLFRNLPSGTNELYTIPAGYGIISVVPRLSTTNTSASTLQRLVVTNSVTYIVLEAATITTNTLQSTDTTFAANYPYLEGETISVVTSTTGANVTLGTALVPLEAPIAYSKFYSLSAGNNTLYTVPVGKFASSVIAASLQSTTIFAGYKNNSGGNRLVTWHIVDNGDTAGGHNQIQANTVADNNTSTLLISFLSNQQSVVINTDAATDTQQAYIVVMER